MSLNADENRQLLYNTNNGGAQVALDAPAFQFSVLESRKGALLTKVILPDDTEIACVKAKYFRFHYRTLDFLEDFAKAFELLADYPRMCIIRGELKPGLDVTGWWRRLLRPDAKDVATVDCGDRWWFTLDLDGVQVPEGLGAPDKLAEAAYYIRDNLLPPYFRGIRCIAVATAKTGRVGAGVFRGRLFFLRSEPASNEALHLWTESLWRSRPDLGLDPSVMLPQQPIYTARPIFKGRVDPVPRWGRVRLLDGYEDYVTFDLPQVRKRRAAQTWTNVHVCPAELLDLTAEDAGLGVCPIEEATAPSDKAIHAMKRIVRALDGCGPPQRRTTLYAVAFELGRLVAEGEMPEAMAHDTYFEAAKGIDNRDGKCTAEDIQEKFDIGFGQGRHM